MITTWAEWFASFSPLPANRTGVASATRDAPSRAPSPRSVSAGRSSALLRERDSCDGPVAVVLDIGAEANRTSADEVLFFHGFRPFLRDGPPKQPFSGRRTCLIHTVSGVNKNRKPPSGGKEDGDGVLLGHGSTRGRTEDAGQVHGVDGQLFTPRSNVRVFSKVGGRVSSELEP